MLLSYHIISYHHYFANSLCYSSSTSYRDVLEFEALTGKQLPYNEGYYEKLSLYYQKDIYNIPKIPPLWIPDTSTEECMLCNTLFSFFKRRHHCRSCGLCICSKCISSSSPSPSFQKIKSTIFIFNCCQKSDLQCKLCYTSDLGLSYNTKDFVFSQIIPSSSSSSSSIVDHTN